MTNETSRYAKTPTATIEAADGRQIIFLRRRFLPPVEASALLAEHLVKEGDRLDNVTWDYLADPELFWRVCDANYVLHPDEVLAEIGRRIRIPMP